MADEILITLRAIDNFSNTLSDFGNIMTGLKSTIDMVAGAFEAVYNFGAQFVESAAESELAVSKLETVLASTGNTFGFTSAQLQGMATNMQNLSGYSDEAEMSAETMLLRFENLNSIFPQALQLSNDLARSLGIDLTTAAQTIGKALDDPASGIGRLNTQFKLFNEEEMTTIKQMAENGDVAGAQALIMERLTEKVGGAAEAYGKTFTGSLDIAKEALDNLKEGIGAAFLPALTEMTQGIVTFVNSPEVQEFITGFADKLSNLFAGLASGDITLPDLAQKFLDWTKSVDWNQLSNDIADALNSVDWAKVGDTIYNVFINILAGLAVIISNIDWGALASAIGKGMADAFAGAAGYIDWGSFVQATQDAAAYALRSIGEAIVDGIGAGIKWAWGNLLDILQFGFDDLIAAVKGWLGISSPSTVFYDIGTALIQGLINGVKSLWNSVTSLFSDLLDAILAPFQPILDLLGIDLGTGSSGTGMSQTNGTKDDLYIPPGTSTTSTQTTTSGAGGVVNNYYYGPVYFGSTGEPGAYYECPSPHPLMTASSQSLLTSGIG